MAIKFSKLIVVLVVMLNIAFTAIILYLVWHDKQEPAALVVAWFGFTSVELWALSKIKRAEVEKEKEASKEWKNGNIGS